MTTPPEPPVWPTWPFTRLTSAEMAALLRAMEQQKRDDVGDALV